MVGEVLMKTIILSLFVFLHSCGSQAVDSELIENRTKIVVLDSGVGKSLARQSFMCKKGILSTIGEDGIDTHGHGSNIIGLIAQKINPKTQCIVSIQVWSKKIAEEKSNGEEFIKGLNLAYSLHASYVNMSMTGEGNNEPEYKAIVNLLKFGTKIIVATGNDEHDLDYKCDIYPACYKMKIPQEIRKNFYVISSNTVDTANKGRIVDAYLDGKNKGIPRLTGTSQATAIFTSELIR